MSNWHNIARFLFENVHIVKYIYSQIGIKLKKAKRYSRKFNQIIQFVLFVQDIQFVRGLTGRVEQFYLYIFLSTRYYSYIYFHFIPFICQFNDLYIILNMNFLLIVKGAGKGGNKSKIFLPLS